MGLVAAGGACLIALAVLVWMRRRLRRWLGRGDQHHRQSDRSALDEAEVLTRGRGPFV